VHRLNRLQSEILTNILHTHKMRNLPHFTICKIVSNLQMCTKLITFTIFCFRIEDCGWEVISFAGKCSIFIIQFILVCRMLQITTHKK